MTTPTPPAEPAPPGEPTPPGEPAASPEPGFVEAVGPAGSVAASGGSARPELAPLPFDGVLTVSIGTGLWLVALVVMLPFAGRLNDDGQLWWIPTAATGFGLGLLGVLYCARRRNRLAGGRPDAGESDPGRPDDRPGRPANPDGRLPSA